MLSEFLYDSNLYFKVGYLIDFQVNNCEVNNICFPLESVDKYKHLYCTFLCFPKQIQTTGNLVNKKSIPLIFQFLKNSVDSRIPFPIKICVQTNPKN